MAITMSQTYEEENLIYITAMRASSFSFWYLIRLRGLCNIMQALDVSISSENFNDVAQSCVQARRCLLSLRPSHHILPILLLKGLHQGILCPCWIPLQSRPKKKSSDTSASHQDNRIDLLLQVTMRHCLQSWLGVSFWVKTFAHWHDRSQIYYKRNPLVLQIDKNVVKPPDASPVRAYHSDLNKERGWANSWTTNFSDRSH